MFPNRTYCDVVHEMRTIASKLTVFNYQKGVDTLKILIEELQVYGNRMEASLEDNRDIHRLQEKKSKLKKEVKALEKKLGKEEKIGVDAIFEDI